MTWSRRTVRAAVDVGSVPLPARATVTMATVRSELTVSTTGPPILPVFGPGWLGAGHATPPVTSGAVTSLAVITTRADIGAPGKAASIRS